MSVQEARLVDWFMNRRTGRRSKPSDVESGSQGCAPTQCNPMVAKAVGANVISPFGVSLHLGGGGVRQEGAALRHAPLCASLHAPPPGKCSFNFFSLPRYASESDLLRELFC